MEATGVYHESLAYYLTDNHLEVSIVLPNKISNFFRTLDVNTITDKTASQAIARFGLEGKLEVWKKPKKISDRALLKNQLHAE
jgi:transposase